MQRSSVISSCVALVAAVACSGRSAGGPPAPGGGGGSGADPWLAPPVATPAAPVAAAPDGRRWIPGDLHMHVAPIDAGDGQALTVTDLVQRGIAAGLEFVIATPHVHPGTLADPARRRRWMTAWTQMAAEARGLQGLTVIPGVEYTVHGHGHFGVSGVDLAALPARDFLGAADRAGAFVVVNHPFAVPTRIRGVGISYYDLSYRPWSAPSPAASDEPALLDGVEVWNQPLGLANLIRRPGGKTGEARAFAAADELARRLGRPVAAVGGSDSHDERMAVTTWVLAAAATEQAILAALRAGATCVGAADAGTMVAHGDADPAGHWARIGEIVAARDAVELKWTGVARLFVDGVDRGEHDGGFVHRGAAGRHTYRIEIGASRCGFVYANLSA